jgi:hypothetical protein
MRAHIDGARLALQHQLDEVARHAADEAAHQHPSSTPASAAIAAHAESVAVSAR